MDTSLTTSIIPTIPLYKPVYPEPLYDVAANAANTVASVSETAAVVPQAQAPAVAETAAKVSASIGSLIDVEA